jgi:HSP20 family protein
MNRAFENLLQFRDDDAAPADWVPAVDITEQDDAYLVKMELPGVQKEDVKITLEANALTVRGEKKVEKESNKQNYHRVERSYGSFQRTFTLPSVVKSDKIDAVYKDGILSITLPKADEAKKVQIEVKVK